MTRRQASYRVPTGVHILTSLGCGLNRELQHSRRRPLPRDQGGDSTRWRKEECWWHNNNNNNNRIQRRNSSFIYNLLTVPRTVSNTYAVARAQSCANHVQHIERSSRATCRVTCHVVRRDSSAIKFWQSFNRIYFSFIILAAPLTDEGYEGMAASCLRSPYSLPSTAGKGWPRP